ncbi:MAG TPA: sugar ABC transporter substrate-binding protein [Candidatus Woesebacteria bacterium]|nr:sugar ABC transporter substrate-binding protein [Candidatus Woesebacteria bacterium]
MDNLFPLPGPVSTTEIPSGNTPLPAPEEAAPPPPSYQAPASVKAPKTKSSFPKIIIPVLIGALVIAGIVFGLSKIFSGQSSTKSASTTQTVTLTYYGLWESSAVMKPVIDEFEKENPTIKISYQLQSSQDYQDRVKTALESQNSPDIVRLHSTWLPLLAKDLFPAPTNSVSATEISTNFYPVVAKTLVSGTSVYGVPMTMEGLALYINTSMFQQKSLDFPKTWPDVLNAARMLKEVDPQTGKITRAGIALGNTANVEHWSDIVSLMLLQAGVKLTDPKGPEVTSTLQYYVDFVNKNHVWDDTLPPSVTAFANEKVAMVIAPSYRAIDIKTINPSLSWQTVSVPQLPDSDTVNWATYWFEGVSKNSKHPQEAWKFLSFLASAKAQQLLFDSATTDREFPQPPANKAVASIAQKNSIVAPYILSMDTARTFYTAGSTHDSKTALNSRLIKYLEDAVNAFVQNQNTTQSTETLSNGFNQVLSSYGLVTAVATPTP